MTFQVGMAFNAVDRVTGTLDNMSKGAEQFGRRTPRAFQRAGRGVSRFGQILAGVVSAQALIGFARRGARAMRDFTLGMAESGDEFAKQARQIGITAESLQAFQFAAERSGVETASLDTAFEQFSRRIGEMRAGTGQLNSTLTNLGQQGLAENIRNAESFEERFALVADKIGNMTDEADKANLAQAAFGRSGMDLVRMLDDGSATVDELRENFVELGGGMSNEAAAAAEEFQDRMTDMRTTLNGARMSIMSQFIPAMTDAVSGITDWVMANRELIQTRVQDFIEQATAGIRTLIPIVQSAWERFTAVVSILWRFREIIAVATAAILAYRVTMGTVVMAQNLFNAAVALGGTAAKVASASIKILTAVTKGFGVVMGVILSPIGLVIAAIAALGAGVYLVIKHWEPISEFFSNLWDGIVGIFTGAVERITGIVDRVMGIAQTVGSVIGGIFGGDDDNVTIERNTRINPMAQAPNTRDAEARRQNIEFQGLLQVAGAPQGSTVRGETRGAPSVRTELLGAGT